MFVVLVAVLAGGCASGENAGTTPTSPTSPTAPSTPTAPPPSNSCLPAAPSGFNVTHVGPSHRVFRWNAVATAIDYTIQIGTSSGTYDLISTNTSQTEYTWIGQSSIPGHLFYARVHARNTCGSGNSSSEISFP
jgi:hypothetical protein